MSFINQTAKIFQNTAEFKYQAVLFGRDAFYIEGAKPIKLDGDGMVFRVPGALITLTGKDLSVKDMTADCVSVVGKIDSFTVTDL